MPLVIAGIDEAGYGPLLGPLCVGMAAVRLGSWHEEKSPNLWSILSGGVCKKPGRGGASDRRRRVAVADSKQLKLANSVESTHPLVHLERGVLAFLGASGRDFPATDAELFEQLGVRVSGHECYHCPPRALPVTGTRAELAIAANVLKKSLTKADVGVADLRVSAIFEPDFNSIVHDRSSKAEATASAIFSHLSAAWTLPRPGDNLGIVCDRQGGRTAYSDFLTRALAPDALEIVEESPMRSLYRATAKGRRAGLSFLVEAESAHLPVALASMMAKYVRELLMHRFNAYWVGRASGLGLELKPTYGYNTDAWRWLRDAATVLSSEDRRLIVRVC